MSSYFQSIRRLKDAQFYINEITRQFAVWKATQDQVDNPAFKSYQRATTNRLICKEQAAIPIKKPADQWQPQIPQEPNGGVLTPPSASSITLWINFDHELEDRSKFNNDGLFEFTNNQPQFVEGPEDTLNFALDFNHNSNSTFDKIWVPFSNSTQLVYDTPSGFSIFTRIRPTVVSDLGTPTTPAPAPASNRLKYFGGPVFNQQNVTVRNIWWGSTYNSGTAQSRRTQLQNEMNTIINSDYYKGLWEYSGCKPITSVVNVVNTVTPIPGNNPLTFDDIWECVQDSRDNALIPNYNSNSTAFKSLHFNLAEIIFVILPYNKSMPAGYGGATDSRRDAVGASTPLVNVCSHYPPADNQPVITGYNIIQTVEQGWAHELIHALVTPSIAGCGSEYGGWLFSEPGFCNNMQHGPPGTGCGGEFLNNTCNCGNRLRTISGTNVLVESYWSNNSGRCIAPGTGDSWTRPPTSGGGGTSGNASIRRYIFQKLDDLDNGATAAIGPDGVVYFSVKKNGTVYRIKTATGAVVVNQWADLWFGFDYATNQPRIFVNTVFYNTPSTETLLWNNTHSHFIIGNYNLGGATGQMRAAMDDFRLYRNSVVTSDQVENLATNGLTISNIDQTPEVSVAVVNRVRIGKPLENTGVFVPGDADGGDVAPPKTSFSTDSFTTTSFTAG